MNAAPIHDSDPAPSAWQQIAAGVATQSWLASLVIHMTIFILLALLLGTIQIAQTMGNAPFFNPAEIDTQASPDFARIDLSAAPDVPTEIDLTEIALPVAPAQAIEGEFDQGVDFDSQGGGAAGDAPLSNGQLSVNFPSIGPMLRGDPGIGPGGGTGRNHGRDGDQSGFAGRKQPGRLGGTGGTKVTELAVAAALHWIARHQNPDGSWSIDHRPRCKGGFCSGPGDTKSESGATALALLPFLAAGQTHKSKGPYQRQIEHGLRWLLVHQQANGDLSHGATQMYSHALATIALCEACGMTDDSRVRAAAQRAINFIESGQNADGGWRYTHGSQDSDTSVFGWQVMALKSGQMAGLTVNPEVMSKSKSFLKLVSSGPYKERYGYTPKQEGTPAMTSVGLLTSQYLGAGRDDPAVRGGVEYMLQNSPTTSARNTYYWYYATQAMHNVQGSQWDEWNRPMKRLLVETQEKGNNCSHGSWSPDRPEPDAWGGPGGRLMVTSLSCLTLEVYYRYLPLYNLDKKSGE